MAVTHKITWQYSSGGEIITKTEDVSAGQEINIDESIADSSTDLEVTYNLDVSALKSFYMVSDYAITVETNSGSTPTDTFTLVANQPIVWTANSGLTNPVTGDITTNIFVTNSSGNAATLKIRALQDPTP